MNATNEVRLQSGPLPADFLRLDCPGAGALVIFEGIVRPLEAGASIAGLDYEAYQPMAEQVLRQLAVEQIERHGLLGVRVEHSVGRVAVGACSLRLQVAAAHRREALLAAEQFIDRMKQDAPLWKAAY